MGGSGTENRIGYVNILDVWRGIACLLFRDFG